MAVALKTLVTQSRSTSTLYSVERKVPIKALFSLRLARKHFQRANQGSRKKTAPGGIAGWGGVRGCQDHFTTASSDPLTLFPLPLPQATRGLAAVKSWFHFTSTMPALADNLPYLSCLIFLTCQMQSTTTPIPLGLRKVDLTQVKYLK